MFSAVNFITSCMRQILKVVFTETSHVWIRTLLNFHSSGN